MNDSTKDYLNKTIFENDPFATTAEEDSHDYDNTTALHTFLEIHQIFTEFFLTVCCLIAMLAYIFLVITIVKSKQLKSSRTNIYILNISILYIIATPLFISMFYEHMSTVLLVQAYVTVLILYMTFAFLLGLRWLLLAKRPSWSVILDKYQTVVITVAYTLATFEWISTIWYAKTHHMIRVAVFFLFYIVILIGSVLLNIIKGCSKLDPNSLTTSYAFYCFNVVVFSLIPLLAFHFLYISLKYSFGIVLISFIPTSLYILHPVLVVYSLGRRNRAFKTGYLRTLALLKGDAGREELDESDGDDANPSRGPIQFTTTGEELILAESSDAQYEVILR